MSTQGQEMWFDLEVERIDSECDLTQELAYSLWVDGEREAEGHLRVAPYDPGGGVAVGLRIHVGVSDIVAIRALCERLQRREGK